METQTVTPTNGHANGIGTICTTKKKVFVSKEAAEQFETNIRSKYPTQAKQYAYACESCPNWHLSSVSPESFGMAQNRIKIGTGSLAHSANAGEVTSRLRYPETLKLEAIRLRNETDMTANAIAEKLGVTTPAVIYVWCRDKELLAKYEKGRIPTSIGDFESEEQKLERQLVELRSKKAAAIEAKKWKFLPCWEGKGVLLKKEQNTMGVLIEDAEELIVMLDDYLKGIKK